jgi:hypothetical protein
MEWIQRNPKTAVALSALAVLVVILIVWGSSGSGKSDDDPTLGAPLATPTTTPTHELSDLPTPTAPSTQSSDVLKALESDGKGSFSSSFNAHGSAHGLPRHHVTVTAQSDGPMMGVGWWIPFADGERKGGDSSKSKTFSHSDVTYGDADLARVLAYGGPYSKRTWCTVVVDGKVTERQEAKGPYGQVFCQG